MNWPRQDRWLRLLRAAGASGAASAWYERLARAYAEPHRHYHNQQHEEQIRREYAWVPAGVFAFKRAEILERFLARERIFAADWFHAKYEQRARRNLEASISALRDSCR